MNLCDYDLERSFLALCLDMPEALDAGLTVEHLASPTHRVALACLLALRSNGEACDDVTLANRLERRGMSRSDVVGLLESVRGAPIRALTSIVPILRQLHDARSVAEAAQMGLLAASKGDTDGAREALAKAAFGNTGHLEFFTLREAAEAACDEFQDAAEAAVNRLGSRRFVKLGLCPTIDRLVTVGPGDTVILAAETNVGKSSLAMTCMVDLERREIPSGLVSIEDPKADWGAKAIGHYGQVDVTDMWAGTPNNEAVKKLMEARNFLHAKEQFARCAVAKSGTLAEVIQAMCTLVRVHGARVLFVDYIQAIEEPSMLHASTKQQTDHVYRRLQATARMLEVPLVIGSQLSRGTDDSEGKEPTIKRLKESGNLENGAQVILMFWVAKDKTDSWDEIRGKIAKLKRAPRRPKWAMKRTFGGILREIEDWSPPSSVQSKSRRGDF